MVDEIAINKKNARGVIIMIDSSCNDEKTVKYNIVLLCHYSFDYDELDSASPVQPGQ